MSYNYTDVSVEECWNMFAGVFSHISAILESCKLNELLCLKPVANLSLKLGTCF